MKRLLNSYLILTLVIVACISIGVCNYNNQRRVSSVEMTDVAFAPDEGLGPIPVGGATQPNILVINLDDADFDVMESGLTLSDGTPILPNLENFRKRAINFSQYYNTTPLCGPSRASLFTGQYAWKTRVKVNQPDHPVGLGFTGGYDSVFQTSGPYGIEGQGAYKYHSLGPWMKNAGYQTIMIGKYLHHDFDTSANNIPPSWDEFRYSLGANYYHTSRMIVNEGTHAGIQNIKDLDPSVYAKWIQEHILQVGSLEIDVDNVPKGNFPGAEDIDVNGNGVQDVGHPELYYRTRVEAADVITMMEKHRRSATGKPCFTVFTPVCPHSVGRAPASNPTAPGFQCRDANGNLVEGFFDMNGDGWHDPCGIVDVNHLGIFNWISIDESTPDFNEDDVSDKPSHLRRIPKLDAQEKSIQNINYRDRLRSMKTFDLMLGHMMNWLRNHVDYKDNTYIVITSDNGFQQGHNRLTAKQTHFLRNSHVPMYVLGPDLNFNPASGSEYFTRTHLSAQIDIAPTCLELAGATIPVQIDGKSFAQLLDRSDTTSASTWRSEGIVIENWSRKSANRNDTLLNPNLTKKKLSYVFESVYSAIRVGDSVYVVWANGEREHYDVVQDPYQVNNTWSSLTAQQKANFETQLQILKQGLPAPIAVIENPVAQNEEFDNGVLLEGFAEDDRGVREVRLVIKNNDTGEFWNGSQWQSAYIQLQANVLNANDPIVKWNYEFHPPNDSLVNCFVSARAYDIFGHNPGTTGPHGNLTHYLAFRNLKINANLSKAQFVKVDTLAADTHTSAAVPMERQVVGTGTAATPTKHQITGWAEDPEGVDSVQLEIQRTDKVGVAYWNGTAWQSGQTTVSAVLTNDQGSEVDWEYLFAPPHSEAEDIQITARVFDKAGNPPAANSEQVLNFHRRKYE